MQVEILINPKTQHRRCLVFLSSGKKSRTDAGLREPLLIIGFDSFGFGPALAEIRINLSPVVEVVVNDCVNITQLERGVAHHNLLRRGTLIESVHYRIDWDTRLTDAHNAILIFSERYGRRFNYEAHLLIPPPLSLPIDG